MRLTSLISKRCKPLELELERIERRLTIQEAVRAELEIEVAQNEQLATNLWEVQKRESAHTVVVEKLQKELAQLQGEALTSQQAIIEAKREVAQAAEEEALLKTELPKRLEESITEAIETL